MWPFKKRPEPIVEHEPALKPILKCEKKMEPQFEFKFELTYDTDDKVINFSVTQPTYQEKPEFIRTYDLDLYLDQNRPKLALIKEHFHDFEKWDIKLVWKAETILKFLNIGHALHTLVGVQNITIARPLVKSVKLVSQEQVGEVETVRWYLEWI
jgi:hypothetical protein